MLLGGLWGLGGLPLSLLLETVLVSTPSVFIGSSREGLPVAEVLCALLGDETKPYLWKQGIFQPGTYSLEALEEQIRSRDFAVLVGTADDPIIKRGKRTTAIRDNISFELGLFMGVLGRRCAFLVVPSGHVELPSDLSGLTYVQYDKTRFEQAPTERAHALHAATLQIKQAIQLEWGRRIQEANKRERQLRESEQFKALGRLYGAITDLRDILILLQSDLISALDDGTRFREAKRRIATKTQDFASKFTDDAKLLGVSSEYDRLIRVTMSIIQALPYPDEFFVSSAEVQEIAAEIVKNTVAEALSDRDPMQFVQGAVTDEISRRLRIIADRYRSWWSSSESSITVATSQLHDALLRYSIVLNGRLLQAA
jgi:predicted nucleotide-binding protein